MEYGVSHAGQVALVPRHLDLLKRGVEHIARVGDLFAAYQSTTLEMDCGSY